ncbi:MAG: hypothetical protein NW237_06830 [Cyanobacteriota bacterium]|nr:hypothetical protein [Cyanobacteriota bacterium]
MPSQGKLTRSAKLVASLTGLSAALAITGCSTGTPTANAPSVASESSVSLVSPDSLAPVLSTVSRKGGFSVRPVPLPTELPVELPVEVRSPIVVEITGSNFEQCGGSVVSFGLVRPVVADEEEFEVVSDSIILTELPGGGTRFTINVTNGCGTDSTTFLLVGLGTRDIPLPTPTPTAGN